MADTELSPTSSARLPPLSSQFPQWSRAAPLASFPQHQHQYPDGIPSIFRVSKKCNGSGRSSGGELGIRSEGLLLPSMSNYVKTSSSRVVSGQQEVQRQWREQRRRARDQVSKKCNGSGGSSGGELGIRSEGLLLPSMSNDPLLHIAQLEQNIRWLHEQHQLMLSSLHQEVEVLRQRNRDLQFQLVFSKGGIAIGTSSSDSSPEDKHKIVLSPKVCNTQTLQVEMLEKDVSELKAALAEAKANNVALHTQVDQQKKQLMAKEAKVVEADYELKLEEAEKLIRRLRRDNEDQRKEIAMLRAAMNKNGNSSGGGNGDRGGNGGGGGGGRHSGGRRGASGQPHDQHRFPPLHSQSYWHHSQQRSRTSPDYPPQSANGGGQRRNGGGASGVGEGQGAPTLPHLNRTYSQPSGSNNGNRSRYYSNGNHYYHRGGGGEGKYRGRGNRDPSQ